ncbi:succinylglutamate desuccinylase/aspartoacylase family protein [Candidatus Uhrbacteria bacterium]|nr:succinylglutamate desuccinylase/aspartoacylase family protein [Candidatus Uhrbacteria bacterium]
MKPELLADEVEKFSADAPGPTIAIVGGVHGNERTGIAVVRKLRRKFESGELELAAGALILALGNLLAMKRQTRGSMPGANLNACFSKAVLTGAGDGYEERRARELARVFETVQLGIDLHATNSLSEPFAVVQRLPTAADLRVLRLLDFERGISDPSWIFAGEAVTLDEFFAARGSGICYETGCADATSKADAVVAEMIAVMADGGWIRGTSAHRFTPRRKEWYLLRESIMVTARGFEFAPGVGEYNFQRIRAKQLIGHHGDEPLRVKDDALLVFPKPAHLRFVGQQAGYLAEPYARI